MTEQKGRQSTALAPRSEVQTGIISVGELKTRSNLLVEAMKAVMKEGVHFGSVGGSDEKFLWKAGAEKLAVLFGLSVDCQVIESRVTPEEVYFRTKSVISAADGRVLAVAEGACSTGEDKYGWRAAICEEEFQDAEAHLRRLKYKKNWGKKGPPFLVVQQVRHDPGEQLNTILQMSQKRSTVSGIRTATGASDIFKIEDSGEDGGRDVPEPTGKIAAEGDLTVTGIRDKSGTNDRGPWKVHYIKLSDGREAGTFSQDFADLAEIAYRNKFAVLAKTSEGKRPGTLELDVFELVPA